MAQHIQTNTNTGGGNNNSNQHARIGGRGQGGFGGQGRIGQQDCGNNPIDKSLLDKKNKR